FPTRPPPPSYLHTLSLHDALPIYVAAQLQPGEVSDFVPWTDGGLIVLMDKREQPDPAKYQQTKATFEERYLKNAREYVFAEWLYDRQRAAGLQPTKG